MRMLLILALLLDCRLAIGASVVDFVTVSNEGENGTPANRETTVSTANALLAAIRGAKPRDRIVIMAGQYRLTETLRITADHVAIVGGGAEIISTASRIIEVRGDDCSITELKIIGTGRGTPEKRQTGVYSDWGRAGALTDLHISQVTECVKLDRLRRNTRGADNWRMNGGEYRPIGMDDGTGYAVICGPVLKVTITGGSAFGVLGKDLRHGVYLSGGASDCTVDGFEVTNPNHAGIAVYSKEGQQPCRNNVIRNCKITGQARGANESAAIEVDGNCVSHTIENNEITDIQPNGILVNTLGLTDTSRHTIARNRIQRVGLDGIRLLGAVDVGVLNNTINTVSLTEPGQRACICIVSWYQGQPIAASKIRVAGNTWNKGPGREEVTINQTPPLPTDVQIEADNQIAP